MVALHTFTWLKLLDSALVNQEKSAEELASVKDKRDKAEALLDEMRTEYLRIMAFLKPLA